MSKSGDSLEKEVENLHEKYHRKRDVLWKKSLGEVIADGHLTAMMDAAEGEML